jgi:hypothetical protein
MVRPITTNQIAHNGDQVRPTSRQFPWRAIALRGGGPYSLDRRIGKEL